MSRAYDALMKELSDEQQNAPSETTNTETPPASEEHVEDTPAPVDEPKPAETPAETPADGQPTETPNPDTPAEQPAPQRKPSEYTQEERAQFAFQRQLSKQKQAYEKQIQELQKDWQSKFDELKKSYPKQQEPKKSRADFGSDDEYIDYLVKQRYETERAVDAEKAAKEAEEKARQQAEYDEQNRILQAEQQAWLSNVDNAFGEDAKGKQAFLSRLQMCMDKGLGAVLDACPVAADYLLHNANGPKVMEKMLADRQTFERVFNDRSTPLDAYYELRSIEAELRAQPTPAPAPQGATQQPSPAPTPTQMPHIGRPGKSGGATQPDIFEDPAEMRAFLRSR